MKNLLKKMLVAVLVGITAVSATVVETSCKKKTDITVGILQVGDHDALNKSRQGFIDTLNKWAKSKNKTIKRHNERTTKKYKRIYNKFKIGSE